MSNFESSGYGNSSSKIVKVHGYTQWFAVNPDVTIYLNGELIGQVKKGEVYGVTVPGPCQIKFTCHVRSVTINVDPNIDTDIYLSFDRVSGCLLANHQPDGVGNGQQNRDKPSILLDILSFLIPLVGLILYFVKKAEYPSSAKSYLICCICGAILNFILLIVGG